MSRWAASARKETDHLMEVVRSIAATGVTIILIEHVMRFLVQLSTRVMIMHHGERIYEGPPRGLTSDRHGDRRLPWRGRLPAPWQADGGGGVMAVALALEDVASGYGQHLVIRGVSLSIAGGNARRPDRPQRPRQDDAAAHDFRPRCLPRRHDQPRRHAHRRRCGRTRSSAAGIVHVPQGDLLFPDMTVLENLRMGAYLPAAAKQEKQRLEEVFTLLPKLKERRGQTASTLSGGERRMVGIGRGLMAGGRVLMLDEPSLGLAPIVIDQIYAVISALRASGRTIVIVEENATRIAEVADRLHLLDNGQFAWAGTGAELMSSPEILSAYLGG